MDIEETTALGQLFQHIITDMKNGAPLWEDFVSKATKLHSCLRATLQAIGLYLEAFQKIADAATNSKGATKDIGTALTRICLRQRAVESRVKSFTSAIMDCLVNPLQDRLEDWKKATVNLDKEHSKETKRARSELKKRSTDTLRLQKKARKGLTSTSSSSSLAQGITAAMDPLDSQQKLLQSGIQQLGECEGKSVRAVLAEGRGRFCIFVTLLRPVLEQEVAIFWELSHVQEALDELNKAIGDPKTLPDTIEQALQELTNASAAQEAAWVNASNTNNRDSSPPSSMGSRKSSVGSAASLQSLSSHSGGAAASQNAWPQRANTMSKLSRPPAWLRAVSQDSGFVSSQDRLFPYYLGQKGNDTANGDGSNCSTPTTSGGIMEELAAPDCKDSGTANQPSSWPNLQETLQFERAASAIMADQQQQQVGPAAAQQNQRRPHTISAAYGQPTARPPIASYHFSPPPSSPAPDGQNSRPPTGAGANGRPAVPKRCSSLERPERPSVLVPKPAHARIDAIYDQETPTNEVIVCPVYVNMHELANLAANKSTDRAGATAVENKDLENSSESSHESSSGYGSQTMPLHGAHEDLPHPDGFPPHSGNTGSFRIPRRGSTSAPPPPPIRRTSSISTVNKMPLGADDLPPPPSPSFLQQQHQQNQQHLYGNIGECHMRSYTEVPHMPSQSRRPPTSEEIYRTSTVADTVRTLSQQPSWRPGEEIYKPVADAMKRQYQDAKGNVADTVRTLTELRHQPASPIQQRRNVRVSNENLSLIEDDVYVSRSPATTRKLYQDHQMTTNYSPSTSRKMFEQQQQQAIYKVTRNPEYEDPSKLRLIQQMKISKLKQEKAGAGQGHPSQIMRRYSEEDSKPQEAQQQTFLLQSLTTRLTQMQMNNKALRVRSLIASRTVKDPTLVHDSLMDQIKRGTRLRTTPTDEHAHPQFS
ncbi:uncharacterized protein LOC132204018 isoform X3 [Neocloeon triangulifer]|uniref:uncharacterized protein LOC132204018 isoform X3 n=1 Tax=Neocloeon triangulifer TaxID=2078957 RepID=UPI00286F5A75|nr:uncharacterized protein LOC132204018 isoform X3 [Neocloeon triangulifer]